MFVLTGLRHFTKQAADAVEKKLAAKNLWKEPCQVDLTGMSAIVTGANSGIGLVTTQSLVDRGCLVHMLCRNPERGQAALDKVVAQSTCETPLARLHIVDMSHLAQVAAFAQAIADDSQASVDILVNNAGCMVLKRKKTAEGFESNFATNTLGTFLLTQRLLPAFKRSEGGARVITVSSGGALTQDLDADDPEGIRFKDKDFDGTYSYAQQKRQQICMTEHWARTHQDSAWFQSMHPGWADTPAVQNSMPDFHKKMEGRLRSPEQGAETVLWLAVSAEAKQQHPQGGLFFLDRQPRDKHLPLAHTHYQTADVDKLVAKLHEVTDKIQPDSDSQAQYAAQFAHSE